MRAADRPVSTVENDATMWAGVRQAPAVRHLDVVLKPLSRPDLGEISVEAAVFAIGRIEEPFDSYGNDVLNMLSRRHASIFRKEGFVYLVDLQSRNGTTVNRVGIGHEPCQLRDGDEICFGGSLSYRIQITPRVRPEGSLTLKLTPESGDAGLETIVVSKFPLLVSKTDGIFGHYKSDEAHGPELKYLSRRHAHIYQKGDQAYIADLGSANGTFVDGERLQEQAVPLQDGALVAFGGKHFVYRVGIIRETGVEAADGETRQHLTEQRVTIHRESLLSREALEARIAAEPGEPRPEAPPPAVVSAKPERKPEVKVSPVARSATLTVASPKAERKGIWGIFGRRAE
ncbi:MAG TPA: FHA domain-containing protein, partial [Steroidobacteraceae bacterium]